MDKRRRLDRLTFLGVTNCVYLPLKDGYGWIAPRRTEPYRFVGMAPRRIGDHARIAVEGREGSVLVILLESENGFRWLVEVKR